MHVLQVFFQHCLWLEWRLGCCRDVLQWCCSMFKFQTSLFTGPPQREAPCMCPSPDGRLWLPITQGFVTMPVESRLGLRHVAFMAFHSDATLTLMEAKFCLFWPFLCRKGFLIFSSKVGNLYIFLPSASGFCFVFSSSPLGTEYLHMCSQRLLPFSSSFKCLFCRV